MNWFALQGNDLQGNDLQGNELQGNELPITTGRKYSIIVNNEVSIFEDKSLDVRSGIWRWKSLYMVQEFTGRAAANMEKGPYLAYINGLNALIIWTKVLHCGAFLRNLRYTYLDD